MSDINVTPRRPQTIKATSRNLAEGDTPSAQFMDQSKKVTTKTDSIGRQLKIKFLSTLDRMRIAKVLGGDLAQNSVYAGYATLAWACTAIDDDVVMPPATILQVEHLVSRLGDEGLTCVGAAYQEDFADLMSPPDKVVAKN